MFRYLALLKRQFRTSLLLAAQYRWDFFVDAGISLFWAGVAMVPLFVVYRTDKSAGIPGWSFEEALVVTGFFILVQGVLDGVINPGLQAVVDHIRKGTLDFVLLKPADAQFLVSTSRFQVFRITSLFTSSAIFIYAFERLHRAPSLAGLLSAFVVLIAGTLVLYSLWIMIVSSAFFVVKVDNLTYLFSSIFDAARWPAAVFPRSIRLFFTVIVPLAVMTTFPAEALLDRLQPLHVLSALGGAVVFASIARAIWTLSIARYTSAGG